MAIFGKLKLESVIQVGDKTRIDATRSHLSPDESAITLMRIDPGDPDRLPGFIDVTATQCLDWEYISDNTGTPVTITLEITTDGAPETFTATLPVISAADDRLFSSDDELTAYEPDILNYIRQGRNSYLDVHRAAQDRILSYLDENRIWDSQGNKLSKQAIVNLEEVNDWSKFMTLKLIFEGLSNATDDIFHEKANRYAEMEAKARNRAALRLDVDGDGNEDVNKVDLRSIPMVRR